VHKRSPQKIHHTPQFDKAVEQIRGGGAFTFITGRAGTGKSTLLRHVADTVARTAPILAPTGIAALNVGGQTIHRFFRFAPGITVHEARQKGIRADTDVYQRVEMIIVDEISMVRADLFDCMDAFLRAVRQDHRPFGGVRVVALGDLYQIPPVVTTRDKEAFFVSYETPYFFSSHVFRVLLASGAVSFVELETVYRQKDQSFVALLNGIRNRSISDKELAQLNARVSREHGASDAVILTPTNDAAHALNTTRLNALTQKKQTFHALIEGDCSERDIPTSSVLTLRRGARVMCVVNDPAERFVNGTLGTVQGFKKDAGGETVVQILSDEGKKLEIGRYNWTIYKSTFNKKLRRLEQEAIGRFSQIPLQLAWAVTIHKSQGKSFDRVVLDLGTGAFASGQVYVALSRCRTLEGLTLKKPITMQQIRLDSAIVRFLKELREPKVEMTMDAMEPVYVKEE
jgi:ATP-dependent exoDNAse (exonuclease V) alpha subunit